MARKTKKKHSRKSYVHNPRKASRRRSYKSNPSRSRRRYKRNPSESVMEIVQLVGGGAAGAIVGAKAINFIPVSPILKNAAMVLAGSALAFFGRKNHLAVGAGIGLASAGAYRLVVNAVPVLAGDDELTPEEQANLIAVSAKRATSLAALLQAAARAKALAALR